MSLSEEFTLTLIMFLGKTLWLTEHCMKARAIFSHERSHQMKKFAINLFIFKFKRLSVALQNNIPRVTIKKAWSSSYGRRLMFRKWWVRILVPYIGSTFFAFIYWNFKIVMFVYKDENKLKRGRDGPFNKNYKEGNLVLKTWYVLPIMYVPKILLIIPHE